MDSLQDDAPAPRLCHLIKWPDFDGYGFNLHAEKSNPGQFIGKIDAESPAQLAGLREGDRIIEVNGVNISNENHRQVVERIKSDPKETKLLVVDPDADSWYKEQDIVIKSSQLNVVYIKTPVPRPQPDSPRAKFHNQSASNPLDEAQQMQQQSQTSASLSPAPNSTVDYQEGEQEQDSIEQSNTIQKTPAKKSIISSPPMSPDSGKGDEVVTIEAEINRQSPMIRSDNEEPELQPDSLNTPQTTMAIEETENAFNKQENEPTEMSLTVKVGSQLSDDDKNSAEARQTHNVSADSGKSSSRATDCSSSSGASSRSGSIADSLENQQQQQIVGKPQQQVAPEAASQPKPSDLDEDDVQTIKNYQQNSLVTTNNNNSEPVVKPSEDTPIVNNLPPKSQLAETPIKVEDNVTTNNINNNNSETDENNSDNFAAQLAKESSKQHQVTQKTINTNNLTSANNNNNNYSGLNLNMTASEMRELIARRKKFDPKKAQMNIRQKYEIIQQM